jgi:tetratricopeptide (TPR) repeat protein
VDQVVAFVSYASADGLEFANNLVDWLEGLDPPVTAWFDRDNPKDTSFEHRIENAIIGSDVVLLVLTPTADAKGSWARREALLAQSWGRPVIALRPHWCKARIPLSASDMTYIDLPSTGDWSRLEHELSLVRPTDGSIAKLTALHRETERLASMAVGPEQDTLRGRAGVLSALIQQERRRNSDPKRAEQRVRRLITDGQRAEAVERTSPTPEGSFHVVDGPPTTAGSALHDRYTERDMLLNHLRNTEVRIVTLCGPSGVGKTALVRDLVPRLQQLGYVGLAYTSTHGPRRITPELLLAKVARAYPEHHTSTVLLERLADRSYNWHQNMNYTMAKFADHPVLVVIDNVEELIDRGRFVDPHLREFAHAVAHSSQHAIRLLLVSRTASLQIEDYDGYARQVDIPPGLPRPFADEFVRGLDVDGTVGLRSATETTLGQVFRLTAGNPGQLELLYGVLRGQRDPDLDELLRSAAAESTGNGDGSRYLMRRAVAELSEPVRRVLQALAVYDRPVRSAAVSWLLAQHYTGFDSRAALDLLCDQRIVHRDGDLYYIPADPHGTVLETVPLRRPDDDRASTRRQFTRHTLWQRAADYFRDVRSVEPVIQDLNSLTAYFNEIDLRLVGREFLEAADLINEIDYRYLRGWGYKSLALPYRERLVNQLTTQPIAEIENRYELATIYLEASRPDEAETVLLEAQELARAIRPEGDRALQLQLAKAHLSAGRLSASADEYRDVLQRCRPEARATGRIGLAMCLKELGHAEAALRQYTLALKVAHDQVHEAEAHRGKGSVFRDLGEPLAAFSEIEEARRLAEQCSDVRLVASCDDAAAQVLIDTGQVGRARRLADSAIKVAMDTGNVDLARETYSTLALGLLLAGDIEKARDAADAAARFFDNQRPLTALALLGIAQFRLGDRRAAQHCFLRAARETDRLLAIEPDAVQVLDIRGLVLAGLARCDPAERWEPARQAYQLARDRTRAPGVVLRAVRLLDELLEGDRSREALALYEAVRGVNQE